MPARQIMSATALVRLVRPHQWVKNVLVFLPIAAAHTLFRPDALASCAVAFAAFSLCASAGYIVNDLADVAADRQHPWKRRRPYAAGQVTTSSALALASVLLAASIVLALSVSWRLLAVVGVYIAGTIAYTFWLKQRPVIDVFALAGFYILRLLAGSTATNTPLSKWFLGFALFFVLSLAFVKRYVELLAHEGVARAREYRSDDLPWIHAVGTSAGYMAVLVLALYVAAPDVTALYARPDILFLLCPVLLFWLTRLWFRAGRRLVHDDPVVEALTDPIGYVVVVTAALIMVAALR